jgi:hypothetical protein
MTASIPTNSLRGFFDEIAAGGMPSKDDVKDAGIPDKFYAPVREQAKVIHKLRSDGNFRAARVVAREAATELLEALGQDWEPPSERGEPLPTDPRALAEIVARRERGH